MTRRRDREGRQALRGRSHRERGQTDPHARGWGRNAGATAVAVCAGGRVVSRRQGGYGACAAAAHSTCDATASGGRPRRPATRSRRSSVRPLSLRGPGKATAARRARGARGRAPGGTMTARPAAPPARAPAAAPVWSTTGSRSQVGPAPDRVGSPAVRGHHRGAHQPDHRLRDGVRGHPRRGRLGRRRPSIGGHGPQRQGLTDAQVKVVDRQLHALGFAAFFRNPGARRLAVIGTVRPRPRGVRRRGR